MFKEILLAVLQAATEFLPVSSSGHLALASMLISQPDLFFFTALHLASLFAVIIYTRKEIAFLFSFKREARRLWAFLIIATIPAAMFGFFFNELIESAFSSFIFLSLAFFFTGAVLFLTKFSKVHAKFSFKNSLFIGLFQAIALFPGVSRSGMTISSALFSGIDREKAARFSFLLFIPLSVGAFALEFENAYFDLSLGVAFLVAFFGSLAFLKLLTLIVKKEKFWIFSFYCWVLGAVSLWLWFR